MSQRLISLDVLRGLTVALMILVNNPGSWAHILPPLRHAAWHGWTPTDLVFPFFLFVVGAAMSLSFARRTVTGDTRSALLRKLVTRTILIFALGLVLNGFPFGLPLSAAQWRDFSTADVAGAFANLRLLGVLQRIALCYFAAGLIVICVPHRPGRAAIAVAIALLYELAMRLPLVAGWGQGSFDRADVFVRWVDLQVLGAEHMYRAGGIAFDPEGLVSTLPAIVTTLLGFGIAEAYLRPITDGRYALRHLAGLGAGLFLAGQLVGVVEPVNKQLWTLTYVAVTGGLAIIVLAVCVWLIDVKQQRRWVRPAVVFGSNPLVAFVGSGIMARLLYLSGLPDGAGGEISPKQIVCDGWLVPWFGPDAASLLFALGGVGIWLGALSWLYHRRIFIKI